MNVELPQEMHPPTDPTDIFVWHQTWTLPHDRTIWKTKAETRGNYPGYTHHLEAIKDTAVRLTPNILSVDNEQTSFAIPTSSMQRVVLESKSDQDGKSVLSVDYVDSRGDIRRMWLRIGRRSLSDIQIRPSQLADHLADAGVQGLQFDRIVPGFTRMGATDDEWDGPTEPPLWRIEAKVHLASGDFDAQFYGRNDAVELVRSHHRMILPYREILGLTVAEQTPPTSKNVVFLAFMDADVLVDLRLHLSDELQAGEISAQEVVSFFRERGIHDLFTEQTGERVPTHRVASEVAGPRPQFISSESREAQTGEVEVDRDSLLEEQSQPFAKTETNDENESPAEQEDTVSETAWNVPTTVSSNQMNKALMENIASGFKLCRSLYDEGLLSKQEFEEYRERLIADIQAIQRLIQISLLHESKLITEKEFHANRRDAMEKLTVVDADEHGA